MTHAEDEAKRQLLEMDRLTTEAQRRMLEAAAGVVLNERRWLALQAAEIATAIGPALRERMTAEMASWATSPAMAAAREAVQHETNRLMIEIAKTVNHQITASPQMLQTLSALTDGPVRLAMETMRSLHLDIANPVFSEFVNKALSQPEPLTKETIRTLKKEHLSKKRIRTLSKKQQFDIMKLIAILSFFILIYSAWKMGQPIDINPEQIANLSQPQINITNIFQAIHPEPVYYLVMRDSKLIPKPGKTRVVIYALPPGTKVKLIMTNHQWIYVHYEEGNINKEGWVRKKYLKRLPA